MAASHRRRGVSVRSHLASLFAKYGPRTYLSGYFISDPPAKAAGVFEELRAGGRYPSSVGGVAVTGGRAGARAGGGWTVVVCRKHSAGLGSVSLVFAAGWV
jgi:hypothetical protein